MSLDSYHCFCCLSTSELSSLYGSSDSTNYSDMILEMFNIKTSVEEYEDGYICLECIEKLLSCIVFKSQVENTVTILQSNGLISTEQLEGRVLKIKKGTPDAADVDDKLARITYDIDVQVSINEDTEKSPETHSKRSPTIKTPTRTRTKPTASKKDPYYIVPEDLRCTVCREQLPNVRVFHTHMNGHYPHHVCDACGKGFPTARRLRRHLPSHRAGPFPCADCPRVFNNCNTLSSHRQRKHSALPLYKCGECPLRFASLARRSAHLSAEHRARRHRCLVCDRTFPLAGSLRAHVRRAHVGETRRPCPRCGAAVRRHELRAHLAAHAAPRPHRCHWCEKSYPRKKALVVHLRTHTNDRRFGCDVCGKKFVQKCTLLRHAKRHADGSAGPSGTAAEEARQE